MQLKQWAIALIAASFVGCIYHFLMPQKHFSSILKPALTAFFIAVMVLPFLPGKKSAALDFSSLLTTEQSAPTTDNFINTAIINAAAQRVKETVESTLSAKHYAFRSVEVSMYIEQTGSISINEITIDGVAESKRQSVHDYLKKKLELEVTVK